MLVWEFEIDYLSTATSKTWTFFLIFEIFDFATIVKIWFRDFLEVLIVSLFLRVINMY